MSETTTNNNPLWQFIGGGKLQVSGMQCILHLRRRPFLTANSTTAPIPGVDVAVEAFKSDPRVKMLRETIADLAASEKRLAELTASVRAERAADDADPFAAGDPDRAAEFQELLENFETAVVARDGLRDQATRMMGTLARDYAAIDERLKADANASYFEELRQAQAEISEMIGPILDRLVVAKYRFDRCSPLLGAGPGTSMQPRPVLPDLSTIVGSLPPKVDASLEPVPASQPRQMLEGHRVGAA